MGDDGVSGWGAWLMFGWMCFPVMLLPWMAHINSAGMQSGRMRVTAAGDTLSFRKPSNVRFLFVAMGIWLGGSLFLFCGSGVIDAVARHQPVPATGWLFLALGVMLGWGIGVAFLSQSGPYDLHLDRDRRTYRFVSGGLLHPRIEVGAWDDMAGVFVRCLEEGIKTKSYEVGIAWRRERRECPRLGSFLGRDTAEALADGIAAKMGLPRVLPPVEGRTSVNLAYHRLTPRQEAGPPSARPFRYYHPTLFSVSKEEDLWPDRAAETAARSGA